jgi:hypothetical protein
VIFYTLLLYRSRGDVVLLLGGTEEDTAALGAIPLKCKRVPNAQGILKKMNSIKSIIDKKKIELSQVEDEISSLEGKIGKLTNSKHVDDIVSKLMLNYPHESLKELKTDEQKKMYSQIIQLYEVRRQLKKEIEELEANEIKRK